MEWKSSGTPVLGNKVMKHGQRLEIKDVYEADVFNE